uniref:hypothetical protein n=1 Tax=Acetatifactor sp. TaxID=1872090 RepID=UPI004055A8FE
MKRLRKLGSSLLIICMVFVILSGCSRGHNIYTSVTTVATTEDPMDVSKEFWYTLTEKTPGVIKGDGKAEAVNVRENAGANYKCVDVLEVGTEIVVYETALGHDGNVWGRIDQGWILMDLVQLESNAAADETAAVTETAAP